MPTQRSSTIVEKTIMSNSPAHIGFMHFRASQSLTDLGYPTVLSLCAELHATHCRFQLSGCSKRTSLTFYAATLLARNAEVDYDIVPVSYISVTGWGKWEWVAASVISPS